MLNKYIHNNRSAGWTTFYFITLRTDRIHRRINIKQELGRVYDTSKSPFNTYLTLNS